MPTRTKSRRILVVGLGNLLLTDDGVGIHAVRELMTAPPQGADVVEVGTAVLDALHLFEATDRVLAIDAMQIGRLPGTIYSFGIDDVADNPVQISLHELGLRATMRFLPESRRPEIRVLGVEPRTIDFGMELTEDVRASLPRLVQTARHAVAAWRAEAT